MRYLKKYDNFCLKDINPQKGDYIVFVSTYGMYFMEIIVRAKVDVVSNKGGFKKIELLKVRWHETPPVGVPSEFFSDEILKADLLYYGQDYEKAKKIYLKKKRENQFDL